MTDVQKYIQELEAAEKTNDEAFTKLIIKSETVLGISTLDLAQRMQVSGPTVSRWKEGKNFPHPIMRAGTFNFLKKEAVRFKKNNTCND